MQTKLLRTAALTAGFLVTAALGAQAQSHRFEVRLDGGQATPPNGSSGSGVAEVILHEPTGFVSVDATFTGLSGSITVAHIHGPAPPGSPAGVLVGLTPSGTTSGTVTGTGTLSPTQVADMLAGLHYLNFHSTVFPSGEIRGQIVPLLVPALPVGWLVSLAGTALLGGVWLLRRRRGPGDR